jgi:hypothetical protein
MSPDAAGARRNRERDTPYGLRRAALVAAGKLA